MAQIRFTGTKPLDKAQLDALIANKNNITIPPIAVSADQQEETEPRENWTPDENKLAQLYQVDQLINRKYKKPNLTGSSGFKPHPVIPFRQIVEMAMLFKVSSETEFFRRLEMTEAGRLFHHQIENCLHSLQITLEMSSESFQTTINHLTQESKAQLLAK